MDKKTVEVADGIVKIKLPSTLYSKSTVMRAAYRMLETCRVRVLGDGIEEITVELKPPEGENTEELIDAFFAELLQAEMEEMNLRRFGDVRKLLLELAIKGVIPDISKQSEDYEGVENELERSV